MVVLPDHTALEVEERETGDSGLNWSTIPIGEIIANNHRLEASVHGVKGRHVRERIDGCKWNVVGLGDMIENAFYLGRFKRHYVDKENGIPFILPSQITEVSPRANKYVSSTKDIDIEDTQVSEGQVLVTRSGTVGIVAYVSKSMKDYAISDDVIRITAKEYPGYLYAFLKSETGRLLVDTNNYGAVVRHIEPDHLNNIPIPDPPPFLKNQIHNLIELSSKKKDESNVLLDSAYAELQNALHLPDFDELKLTAEQFDETSNVLNYLVPVSSIDNRLDGSYHTPLARTITQHLKSYSKELVSVGNSRISQEVILPGRFKRVYVKRGNGTTFIGGKQILELDPNNKKYLSVAHHGDRIKNQLTLRENMVLITCSGTIGKTAIVPKHWDGWAANQHIIRVVASNNNIAGYLYAWLSSDYALPLIIRYTYGAVVDEIDDKQVSNIVVPLLHDENTQQRINDKVIDANKMRAEAYEYEQEALNILDEQVLTSEHSNQ